MNGIAQSRGNPGIDPLDEDETEMAEQTEMASSGSWRKV